MAISTISSPYAITSPGSILQVVQATYSTETTTTSASFVDTGLTATITPKFANSKILVLASNNGSSARASGLYAVSYFQTVRNSTVLTLTRFQIGNSLTSGASAIYIGQTTHAIIDSPSTTSATTYKMQMASNDTSIITTSCINNYVASITLMEIAG